MCMYDCTYMCVCTYVCLFWLMYVKKVVHLKVSVEI